MSAELVDIANQLDQLGLHQEANLIDDFLQKRAGILSLRERPFLAALAQVLLKIKKYEPEQQVTEAISLPGSQKSLYGLTKSRIQHLVAETLRRFIEAYAKPKLEKQYAGTEVADKYGKFISIMEKTLSALEHTFRGPADLQRRAKEIGRVVDRLRSSLDRLLAAQVRSSPLVVKTHDEAQKQLDALELALHNRDIEGIEKVRKWFTKTFPAEHNDNIPKQLVDVVAKSYSAITTDPHKQQIRDAIEEVFAHDEEVDFYGGWSNVVRELKKREDEYKKAGRRQLSIEQLTVFYQQLEKMVIEVQQLSDKAFQQNTPGTKEKLREKIRKILRDIPGGKFNTPEVHDYQNMSKLYSTIKGETEMLALWLKRYLEFNEVPGISVGNVDVLLDGLGQLKTASQEGIIIVAEGEDEDEEGLFGDRVEEEEIEEPEEPEQTPPESKPKKSKEKEEKDLSAEELEEMKSSLGKEKVWEPGLYIPFAQFLFYTSNESQALDSLKKTIMVFRENVKFLNQKSKQELSRAEAAFIEVAELNERLNSQKREIEQKELWELWSEKYIRDTFDTINAFFRPRDIEEKDVVEAQKEAMTGFKDLLGFSL